MKTHVSSRKPKSLMRQLSVYLVMMGILLLVPLVMLYAAAVIVFTNRTNLDTQKFALQTDILDMRQDMVGQSNSLRAYIESAQPIALQPFQTAHSQYLTALHDFQNRIRGEQFSKTTLALNQTEKAANVWYTNYALWQIANVKAGKLMLARADSTATIGSTLFQQFLTPITKLDQALAADGEQLQMQADSGGSLLSLGSFVLALLTVALLWFLALRFSRVLRFQLSSLKVASLHFVEGQFSSRAAPLRSIELNEVGQTFNRMADVLQEQQIELTERNNYLNAANNTFRALLDSTDDAILYVSADGHIRDVNRRLVEQWGEAERSVDSLRDIPIMEYVLAVKDQLLNPDEYVSFMERTLIDNEQDFTFALPRKLPEPGDYIVFSTPVRGAQGEYLGRFFSIRDVTHEKAVDRMKSEFVSLVSHELRTPLTSIKGYIDLLLREQGQLDEMQRESLEIAQKNARRLVALINDLLDLSHLEEGKVVLRRTMFDVQTIIKDVIQLFQTQLQSREQTLVTNFSPLPSLVIGDPERVAQIFMNLLSNAHKYTPVGGRIEVTVRQVASQVQVAIHDNGIGMSAEEQRKLFTRFYRVKNHITQEAGGTGLGLAITKTLIEMHNGEIQVSSAPGEGSTFTFTLPLVQEQIVPPASTPSASPGKRLLLVEDDTDQVALYRRYLTEYGYDVVIASTGKSAIQLAESAQPDLICLDIGLPDINGLQVLEQLKSQEVTAEIPVLILSITDNNGEAQLLGAVDHVRKPISQDDLLQLIHAILKDRNKPLVLVAEGDSVSRVLIVESLQQAGFRVIETFDADSLVSLVVHHRPNLIVSNVDLLFSREPCVLSELLQICSSIKASLLVAGMFPQSLHEQMKELMKAVIVHSIGNPANVQEVIAAAKKMPTRK